ncbi:MAG: FHA domain-containing protein [Armatimonadetes bacterium]|nr:FHA domain-containing protein [Armatimonadota bacterium]
MARITRYFIFSAIGGIIGWAIVEPFEFLTPSGNPVMGYEQILLVGALVGMFIGSGLGVAEALSGVSRRDAVRRIILGASVGAVGGAIGLAFGNFFYRIFHVLAGERGGPVVPVGVPVSAGPPAFISFALELVGRSIGWALIGLFIGLSQGLATQSTKKMANGAVGGFLGGGIGGFSFQILGELNGTQAIIIPVELMRLIGFTVTAGAIGLFIGFIEEVTKQAWLVHLKGRNEGREFLIFKPETVVGRDEFADVPVFGDPNVEPRHFVIRADERRHRLQDLGTSAGTLVNGQRVQQHLLCDGDTIQIGAAKLLFRDKASRSVVGRSTDSSRPASIPASEQICPYCGNAKDSAGNCLCTVGAGPAAGSAQEATVVQSTQPTGDQTMPLAAPASVGARLVGLSGAYAGQTFILSPAGETTIGRQQDRQISLTSDTTVSRQHAGIVREGGQFIIYDTGSANGTYINGARITRQVLNAGDIVRIGTTEFRFES